MMKQNFYMGVDLGQKKSHTAIAVVEWRAEGEEYRNPVTWAMEWQDTKPPRVMVRYLRQIPLGTSYTDVVDEVKNLAWSPELRGNTKLVVDATGAGTPVVDLIRKDADFLRRACELNSVTITNGSEARKGPRRGDWSVPKDVLINGLLLIFEENKLEIAKGMRESKQLIEELVHFGKGDGHRDDLVLAVALAVWRMNVDHEDPLKDGGTKVRKGPMTAQERQAAEEFVATIFGVAAKRFRE